MYNVINLENLEYINNYIIDCNYDDNNKIKFYKINEQDKQDKYNKKKKNKYNKKNMK